ncbi:hypothetical protein AOLI_G00092850 [Acnodon oligacanthus]
MSRPAFFAVQLMGQLRPLEGDEVGHDNEMSNVKAGGLLDDRANAYSVKTTSVEADGAHAVTMPSDTMASTT